MDKQPIVNIGMLGSVSDGKSTTVYSLTGIKTQRHSNEIKRNITIKPGYANMKIYKENNKYNTKSGELVHHISFIDCPGHYQLIVTMLSCIKIMDGIILVVSASESIDKKPQLIQHIMAIKIANIKNVIVLFNKLDLVKKEVALDRYNELKNLLKKYEIEPKIIIPVCMSHMLGVDKVLESIMKYMPPIIKDTESDPIFMISRSFDINKNNTNFMNINGGVIGGSLIKGCLKVGDEIIISPGINNIIKTKIVSLKSDTTDLDIAYAGGLIGIGTNIDPFYCKNDNMIGMIASKNKLNTYTEFKIKLKCIEENINNFNIIIISGTSCIEGNIKLIEDNIYNINLLKPICIDNENMIIVCDKTDEFKIIGYGFLN